MDAIEFQVHSESSRELFILNRNWFFDALESGFVSIMTNWYMNMQRNFNKILYLHTNAYKGCSVKDFEMILEIHFSVLFEIYFFQFKIA